MQMESLKTALFEDPLYLYLVLAVAELALVFLWQAGKTRRRAAAMAIPVVLAGAVFVAEAVVVTDREQLTAALREIALDARARGNAASDFQVLATYLDESVQVDLGSHGGKNLDRKRLLEAGRAAAKRFNVRRVELVRPDVQTDGQQATVSFGTIVFYAHKDFGEGRASIRWRLYWARRQGAWRIVRIGPPEFDAGP